MTKLIKPEVHVVNGTVTTSSVKVADVFGKRHQHVIDKIQNLECSKEFTLANFSANVEKIMAGAVKRDSKYYEITKDGFMFLVMGFTGKKAAVIKEAFIAKFNEMEDKLRTPANTLPYQPLTPAQQAHIQRIVSDTVFRDEYATYAGVYKKLKIEFDVGSYKQIPADKYPMVCKFLNAKPLEGELIQHKKYHYPVSEMKLLDNQRQMIDAPLITIDDLDTDLRTQNTLKFLDEVKKDGYEIGAVESEVLSNYYYARRLKKILLAIKNMQTALDDVMFDKSYGHRVFLPQK